MVHDGHATVCVVRAGPSRTRFQGRVAPSRRPNGGIAGRLDSTRPGGAGNADRDGRGQ
jgi:hypothetical protein